MKYFLIVALVGALLLVGCTADTAPEQAVCSEGMVLVDGVCAVPESQAPEQIPAMDGEAEAVKTFYIDGDNFKFTMDGIEAPDLQVNVGDKVRIELTSVSGFHDWVLDEFSAATERINTGQTTSVEFTADRLGTFEYYCSVGSHRAMGMRGNFIVI